MLTMSRPRIRVGPPLPKNMIVSRLHHFAETLHARREVCKVMQVTLSHWAKIRWPEDPPNRLQAIGEKEKKLKDPLLMMERHHYAEQNEEWDAQQLAEAFKKVCHMPQEKIDENNDRIRELYPA